MAGRQSRGGSRRPIRNHFVVGDEGGEVPGWLARMMVESAFVDSIRGDAPHIRSIGGLLDVTQSQEQLARHPGHDLSNRLVVERYCLDRYWVLQEERTIVRTFNEAIRGDFLTRITPAYRFQQYVWENPIFRFNQPQFDDPVRNDEAWSRINRRMTREELRRRNGRRYDNFYNGY